MYIRTIGRRNKDGSQVRYVQLAHNAWDREARCAKAQVLFSFGREEKVDRAALQRLVGSIIRFLGPEAVLQEAGSERLRFIASRPMGGAWLLDRLWQELGIDRAIGKRLKQRRFRTGVERMLFALVANRALAPASKRRAEDWVREDVYIPGLETAGAQQFYRAMGFLLEAQAELQKQVYWSVANLLNLEVDLLYFDTTSTYFEVEDEDGEDGLRRKGLGKDHRPDRPQAVIGLAVTREGIPVRSWVWPGNRSDMDLVKEARQDLVGWELGRVITVVDRGFSSEENLRYLQRAGGHYIAGVKLRDGKDETEAALGRPGRYQRIRDNMEIKEITVGDGEARRRYVLVRNPGEAARDRTARENLLARLKAELATLRDRDGSGHARVVCRLMAHESYGRYLRLNDKGKPVLNLEKIKAEERLDGKYLLRTSDDTLSAEDTALGYRQLLQIEEAFRTLKTRLELRPIYHRLEERIRAHVMLCWLALLLIRLAENRSGSTWLKIRDIVQRVHLGEFRGKNGALWQSSELNPAQAAVFNAVKVSKPPRMLAIQPTATDGNV